MYEFSEDAISALDELWLDEEDVLKLADEALTRPSDAGFWDDDLYKTHTLAFHTPSWGLTSDYMVGEANYRVALEELKAAFPDDEDVEATTVGHWTYSTFSCIKVRVLDAEGKISPVFVHLAYLVKPLENYPLIDGAEEVHSDLEWEVWEEAVEQAIYDLKREDEYEDKPEEFFEDVRRALTEEFGPGWTDPGYISEEMLEKAVEIAENPVPRQEISLF